MSESPADFADQCRGEQVADRARRTMVGLVILVGLVAAGCTGDSAGDQQTSKAPSVPATEARVVVTNYPLQYFTQRLLGDDIEIDAPFSAAADPAFWQPADTDLTRMQTARLILINGADYETWLPTVTLPESRVVATANAFRPQWIEIQDAVTHRHGDGEEHAHAGIAIHTWLDPRLAKIQAREVSRALVRAFPEQQKSIEQRWVELEADLVEWDEAMSRDVDVPGGVPMYGSHPVYQYLASRLQRPMVSRHWEPSQMPDEAERRAFESELSVIDESIMLWEDEPTPETRQWLEGLGVKIVVYRVCATQPASGDFLSEMQANLSRLKSASGSNNDSP